MIVSCTNNLIEIKTLVNSLKANQYKQPLSALNNMTIGKHIRHILEFYICLFEGKKTGSVNYDGRKRDLRLEEDISFTLNKIDEIINEISKVNTDIQLTLLSNFSIDKKEKVEINTTLLRELAYCLEHSIHHQAILKYGLHELKIEDLIHENFGVAPSTTRYNSN